MDRNNKILGLQVLLVCACLFVHGGLAWANDPQSTMQATVENVMEILTEPALAGDDHWQERREMVSEEVAGRFDFAEMAKRALAQTWNERSSVEQEKFVTLFKEILKDTYVERLKTYSDGSYKVVFDKVLIRGDKAVVNSLVTQQGREISAAYKMYQKDNQWFVYDVVIEGVSLVSNYRSQFISVIQKEGYEELVHRLEEKIAESKSSANASKEIS
ncbi:MAG: ABC transporter substrate-binding protein [Proteobacteria bacterium]|nr:ABC transporter substrate-binding protein [Pseudomonadota bacterium]MBU1640302.1 ABC transporter substrate-binding protein [Pseudomonadota bacterium]